VPEDRSDHCAGHGGTTGPHDARTAGHLVHMADHSAKTTVQADPDDVYDYLADVGNLPDYFPMMTSAEQVPGEDAVRTTAVLEPEATGRQPGSGEREVEGEAWFVARDDERRIEWGRKGSSDYRGELRVEPEGAGSRVSLLIHSEQDHDGIDESLARSLDSIATRLGPSGQGA
jgi:carbon monoxide dehydrogenase subunit G